VRQQHDQIGLALANYESNYRIFPTGLSMYTQVGGGTTDFAGAFYQLLPLVDAENQYYQYNFDFTSRHNNRNSTALFNRIPVFICPSDLANTYSDPTTTILNPQGSYAMNFGTIPTGVYTYGSDIRWLYNVWVNGDGFFGAIGGSLSGGLQNSGRSLRLKQVTDGTAKTMAFGEQSRFIGEADTFPYTWAQNFHCNCADPFYVTIGFAYAVPRINAKPSTIKHAMPCITKSGSSFPNDCNDWITNYPANDSGQSPPSEFGEYGFRSQHPGGVNVVLVDGSVQFVSNNVDRFVFAGLSTPNGGETYSNNAF